MVPAALLQLVLLPVDDDRRDLLVHEDEYGGEQRGHDGRDGGPPGVRLQLLGCYSGVSLYFTAALPTFEMTLEPACK